MEKTVVVCPNCGMVFSGVETLPTASNLAQQIGIDFDPVAGRFLCPKCNYSGLPIEMTQGERKKATFGNKKIAPPLARANPDIFRYVLIFAALVIVIMILMEWGLIQDRTLNLIIWLAIIVAGFGGVMLIPKYKKSG